MLLKLASVVDDTGAMRHGLWVTVMVYLRAACLLMDVVPPVTLILWVVFQTKLLGRPHHFWN